MDNYTAVIYGIIQGTMEFIPVSSSGHLALLPHFLKLKDPGVFFDLTMHLGTGLSVLVYFWKEVVLILKDFFYFICFCPKKMSAKSSLMKNMLISTVFTFVTVLILQRFNLDWARDPRVIALNLLFFGFVMYLADKFGPNLNQQKGGHRMEKSLEGEKALWIGIFQAVAIFPGVSRSGSTLTISRFMGLSRTEASRYTFILSLPVIFGGFLIKLYELPANQDVNWSASLVGGVVSFIVGLLTIKLFLQFIQRLGLGYFTLYRTVLALILVWFI
jgi:undecaprenyl-diphosphatase